MGNAITGPSIYTLLARRLAKFVIASRCCPPPLPPPNLISLALRLVLAPAPAKAQQLLAGKRFLSSASWVFFCFPSSPFLIPFSPAWAFFLFSAWLFAAAIGACGRIVTLEKHRVRDMKAQSAPLLLV